MQLERKLLKLNKPQLLSILSPAKTKVKVWPRGTGKSTDIAFTMKNIVKTMPRALFPIAANSYNDLYTRTMPAVIDGLEKIGVYKDIDYVFGSDKHPINGKMKLPFQSPLDYNRSLLFLNGTCFPFVTLGVSGDARGMNTDGFILDEALKCKKMRVEEDLFPTVRANKGKWGNNPLHWSKHISTSKPISLDGQWILDFGKYYEEDGSKNMSLQNKLVKLQLAFIDASTIKDKEELLQQINELDAQINWYVKTYNDEFGEFDSIYYSEASAFDNLQNVGYNYLRSMRRNLSDLAFLVEVLNKTLDKVDDQFYSNFGEHCIYESYDDSYIESLGYEFSKHNIDDVKRYSDTSPYLPLDIACDYNNSINTMVVGQEDKDHNEYRFVNGLYVKSPLLIKDNAKQFAERYAAHHCKEVNYYYDTTATWRSAKDNYSYSDEYSYELNKLGWRVNRKPIGQIWTYEERYNVISKIHRHELESGLKFYYNKETCKYLILSIQQTGVRISRAGKFEKDKRLESKLGIDQAQTTHFTEAMDCLIQGKLQDKKESNMPVFALLGK
jgi:hypothetical protein